MISWGNLCIKASLITISLIYNLPLNNVSIIVARLQIHYFLQINPFNKLTEEIRTLKVLIFCEIFLKSWSTNLSLGGYNAGLFDRFSIVIALCYPKISFAKPTKGYPTASNILDFYFLVWVLPFLAPKGKKKCVKSTSKEQFRGFVYRSLTLIYKGLLTIHTVISSQIPVVIQ